MMTHCMVMSLLQAITMSKDILPFHLCLSRALWLSLVHYVDTPLTMFSKKPALVPLSLSSHAQHFFFSYVQLVSASFPHHVPALGNNFYIPSPTCINTDKRAFGNVIQAANTPALVLCLEQLQANLQSVLHQPICAHVWVTFAAFVTLIHPGRLEWKSTMTRVLETHKNNSYN